MVTAKADIVFALQFKCPPGISFLTPACNRGRPMTLLRAPALAPHKQSISLKTGDKMGVIPAFHRSSFEVGIACDFCFVGRRLSICLICAGVLPRTS